MASMQIQETVMNSINPHALAAHVLVVLAHARGRAVTLDDLAEAVGVRKADVRAIVSRLDREGHVDALRLRLTLSGLALAASLDGCKLPALRTEIAYRAVCAA
jgi:transcription initiation factor IIE alpha subunit